MKAQELTYRLYASHATGNPCTILQNATVVTLTIKRYETITRKLCEIIQLFSLTSKYLWSHVDLCL